MSKKKSKGKADEVSRRRGNNRPIRLPCAVQVSVPLPVDEAITRACEYLGQAKSQYIRDACIGRLINERFLAPPSNPPQATNINTTEAA
jgi:hypothetical protein